VLGLVLGEGIGVFGVVFGVGCTDLCVWCFV